MVFQMNQPKPHRAIRSFVRRQGRITANQTEALKNGWPQYGLELHQIINFDEIFNRQAPRILEIGFGMGQSLLKMASQNPEKDFIGVEVHKPGVGSLLAGIQELKLNNIRIFCADAVEVLTKIISNDSLDGILIFFPDPWPKKRHHKRRLIQAEFVKLLWQKLKINGVLHLATDWQNYAEHMLNVLSNEPDWENVAGLKQFSPRPDTRPLTKFELRGQRLGHGVWDLMFRKVGQR